LGTLALGVVLANVGCSRQEDVRPADVLAGYREDAEYPALTIDYPWKETLFPPDIAPPTFRWRESQPEADTWLVSITCADQAGRLGVIAKAPEWTPDTTLWAQIKWRSREKPATAMILGFHRSAPRVVLSRGRVTFRTSQDEVGAPLFYREVNLPFVEAVKDPSRIRWRFGLISALEPPPVVLENLPVCGNCHSFSADGAMLGMDVDYANDKGSYAFTPIRADITLATSDIITWTDFRRDDGQLTFGLLSQVSPDGRYAISTVKDRSVFVPKPERAFSQLFFPIRGILAVYDRAAQTYRALPGADDPEYVQSNPAWSPDGKYIVFARSKAHRLRQDLGNVLLTKEECAEFLEEGKTFLFDLYRIPFNDGAGGLAEPLAGAAQNGMSNYFAKYSPDGRWIVFCKARSYMLLQPDSELYIIPAEGGEARRLSCNTNRMNSWHSWSPNGKWLVFSSKAYSDYTQLCLTHIDEEGRSSPAVVLSRLTAPDRAANIPEFVNAAPTAIARIRPEFLDDVSYVRAGDAFLDAGRDVAGAAQQYRKALELNPRNAVAHSNLGGLLVNQGLHADGVAHLQEAIRLDPANGSPYYNLGMLQARHGQVADAIHNLTLAVQYRPGVTDAHRMLGSLLCNQGELTSGIEHLAEAVRLDPKDAAAQYCLGTALAAGNRIDEAIAHLALAVQLDPQDVTALDLLGQLWFLQGKSAEGIACLAHADRLEPDSPRRLGDLAWMLALAPDPAQRDAGKAVELAQRACDLTKYGAFAPLDVLGISYAAAGRFSEALEVTRQALNLARAAGEDQVAAGIQARIDLYEKNRSYEPLRPGS